jgi:hypothetical protein
MRRSAIALGALLTAIATPARAGDAFARTDPLDELSLARAAEAAGDAALIAAMQVGRYEALVAIRASVHAHVPEQLIAALAAHACGRDPTLAPEAAYALGRLAERLTPSELAQREALQSDLARARASLRCDRPARADIAATLREVATALTQ